MSERDLAALIYTGFNDVARYGRTVSAFDMAPNRAAWRNAAKMVIEALETGRL